jgi:hypothetical protein
VVFSATPTARRSALWVGNPSSHLSDITPSISSRWETLGLQRRYVLFFIE